jgi:hypothetical protein
MSSPVRRYTQDTVTSDARRNENKPRLMFETNLTFVILFINNQMDTKEAAKTKNGVINLKLGGILRVILGVLV